VSAAPDKSMLISDWLLHVAKTRFGLEVPSRRMPQFQKAVNEACGAAGEVSLARYLSRLESEPLDSPAVTQFVARFTIKESYFFRDEYLFRTLREHVLPELIRKRGPAPLAVWSAGCSNGEEAYTLGILIEEVLGTSAWTRSTVVGTDLDALAVSRARAGAFGEWSVRSLGASARGRYFEARQGGHVVRPRFARHVRFETHNLVDENAQIPEPGRFDLILCRNVSIYFTDEGVVALYTKLARALLPGGVLVIAASDARPRGSAALREVVIRHRDHSLLAYGRADGTSPWSSSTPPGPRLVSLALPEGALHAVSGENRERDDASARANHGGDSPRETALDAEESDRPTRPAVPNPTVAVGSVTGAVEKALALADGGDSEEALRMADEAVRVAPLNAASQFALALIHLERGDHHAAEAAFRRTLYLKPDHVHAHYRLGLLCARAGDDSGARRAFFNALRAVGHVAPEGSGLVAAIGVQLAMLKDSR
jgi:chemotaxis protein methyltransferase CheR